MIPLGPVVARARLQATRAAAWVYLADADRRAEWWPELRLEPQVGGAIGERWSEDTGETSVSRDASGTVDVWVDGHAIGFTWREAGDQRDTAVLLTLRSQGDETGITVTETGFDGLPDSAARAAGSQDGWQVLLRDLSLAVTAAAESGTLPAVTHLTAAEPGEPAPAAGAGSTDPGDAEPQPATASAHAVDQTGEAPALDAAADATPAEHEAGAPEFENPAAEPAAAASAEAEPAAEAAGAESAEAEPAEAAEPAEPADAEELTGLDDELNDTVRIERLPAAPAAAPAPEAQDPAAAEAPGDAPELDFDALIRGDQPERR
ncbi:SRPBCC family protein [Leucobacter chromiireducens]|uniref:SRPBCC domain-containing protein n=1 Tax=Leucobacter chromiireducens subsp. solipictus TaxID=398235 RepID=A0ABS1SDP8_9MICO|nr:SRPBCC domain-containing protein [Leucobacter chromiireducens]MBL3678660.1 SRPBCC domain-containing protein [Leucobacter chromiireducens subsp. solipictus]